MTVEVLHADCRDALARMADEGRLFDLIVTSPPYDAEKAYEGRRDLDAYARFAAEWTALIPAVLKPSGSFWLNVGYTKIGANETLPLTYLYHGIRPKSLRLVQEIVWEYPSGMAYKRRFAHRTERWMWFALNPDGVYFDLDSVRDLSLNVRHDSRNNPLGKNPTDCWRFTQVLGNHKEKGIHPCPFPERMIERVIRACSPDGGVVLDPFSGSGTVGRVASRLGRDVVLIEREANYVADIHRRMDALKQDLLAAD